MTEGVIWKQLLFFAIPLLLGNLFQLLYNTVDSIVVGNFVGGGALAAVGASNPIINLLVSFFMGIATGAGVVISRYFGAGDRENLSRAVHTSMMLVFLAGIFLMAAGAILSPLLLKATGTPEDVLPDAVVYMRSVGDSKRPLYYLIVASVVNIGLDLLFVIAFQMGVAGVAWATLIAQSLSAFLVLLNLFRSGEPYRLELKKMRISRGLLGEIVRLGLPAGLQNAIISLSNVVVQANINRFGTTAMAGCAAYGKLDGFANLPVNSFSMAATTFIGQNIGARNRERVKKGARVSVFLSMGVIGALSVLLLLCGKHLLRIFTPDPDILSCALRMLRFLAPAYIFLAAAQALCGVIRGAGQSMVPMAVLIGNFCVLRMIWISLAMPAINSIDVVFLGYSLTWTSAAVCMLLYAWKFPWVERGLKKMEGKTEMK